MKAYLVRRRLKVPGCRYQQLQSAVEYLLKSSDETELNLENRCKMSDELRNTTNDEGKNVNESYLISLSYALHNAGLARIVIS